MAIFGAAFQIGRSALAAYQAAITIAGQNIANVGNPDYTRQSGRLVAVPGGTVLGGPSPGLGVSLGQLRRHLDEALEARLRMALASRQGAEETHGTLSRVESLYGELTETDLSSQLTALFNSFTNLQTDPAEITARDQVLANARAVVQTIQRQRRGLLSELNDLNSQAETVTGDANALAAEVASLNEQIAAAQARGQGGDSPLRDRRDTLLRDLAQLVEIQTRPQDSGVVNVYVGSEPLVEGSRARVLTAARVRTDGLERVEVRFADSDASVTLRSGRLAALVTACGAEVAGQLARLDQLARGLVWEVNRVHSTGQGLVGYTSIEGTFAVDDPNGVLNGRAAGLDYPVQNGTFLVRLRDMASGQVTEHLIQVDLDGLGGNDTTLTGLAAALDSLPGLNASVTADNRLRIGTDAGLEVSFAEDSSGALAALGIGTFFAGTDAATLALNDAVAADPRLIASALDGTPGDGSNAGRLAGAAGTASDLLGGLSVEEFHESTIHQLAVATAGAQTAYDAADAVYSSLLAQREAASGVSLDEEAINLTMFERAFQGASRYLSVLDTLSTEVLTLVS